MFANATSAVAWDSFEYFEPTVRRVTAVATATRREPHDVSAYAFSTAFMNWVNSRKLKVTPSGMSMLSGQISVSVR